MSPSLENEVGTSPHGVPTPPASLVRKIFLEECIKANADPNHVKRKFSTRYGRVRARIYARLYAQYPNYSAVARACGVSCWTVRKTILKEQSRVQN